MAEPDPVNPPAPTPPAPVPTPPAPEQPLGEAGLRALQAERDAAASARAEAAREKARADALEAEKLTETQKLQKDAEEGRRLAATATTQLREAKLIAALGGQGLVGPNALAASKLITGIEYDAEHMPTNLSARIDAARAIYPESLFTGATPPPPPAPTFQVPAPVAPPAHPHVHQGVAPPAPAPDEDAMFAGFMRATYPDAVPAKN